MNNKEKYFNYSYSSFIVLLGAQSSQGGDPGSEVLQTYDVYVHENYDPNRINNDISLLRLPQSVSPSRKSIILILLYVFIDFYFI